MTDEGQHSSATTDKTAPKKQSKREKKQKRQLRIVFDTNVLYTGSASDLVRQEVGSLVAQSKFPDLEILWYLPEIVRHERQYQMGKRAQELIPHIGKVERLLGHNLNITSEILTERVEKTIELRQRELGLLPLKPEYARIDWDRVVLDAAYRRPPFQEGETEKGFRDALVVESFMRLVADSPKTSKACRIVFVTGDKLVRDAVGARIADLENVSVTSSLEELRELINTLVSTVDESFIAKLRPKAEKLFFVPKDETTLYYREHIRDKLQEKFKQELIALPPGATGRQNGTWRITPPNFSRKVSRRIHWSSRVTIEMEATKTVKDRSSAIAPQPPSVLPSVSTGSELGRIQPFYESYLRSLYPQYIVSGGLPSTPQSEEPSLDIFTRLLGTSASEKTVTSHRGSDVYEVLWSVDITPKSDLRRPTIDDILHIETTWEAVS